MSEITRIYKTEQNTSSKNNFISRRFVVEFPTDSSPESLRLYNIECKKLGKIRDSGFTASIHKMKSVFEESKHTGKNLNSMVLESIIIAHQFNVSDSEQFYLENVIIKLKEKYHIHQAVDIMSFESRDSRAFEIEKLLDKITKEFDESNFMQEHMIIMESGIIAVMDMYDCTPEEESYITKLIKKRKIEHELN